MYYTAQSKTYRPISTEFIFVLLRSVHLYLYLTNEKNDCHCMMSFSLVVVVNKSPSTSIWGVYSGIMHSVRIHLLVYASF